MVSIEIFHQGLAWYFPVSTGIDTLLQPLKGNHATQGKLFERRPYLSGNTAKFLNERNMYLSFWKIMPIRPQGRGWEGNQLPWLQRFLVVLKNRLFRWEIEWNVPVYCFVVFTRMHDRNMTDPLSKVKTNYWLPCRPWWNTPLDRSPVGRKNRL